MQCGRAREPRTVLAWMAGALIIAGLTAPVSAAADPKATVSVTVILAKKGPPHLHPALQPMWDTLRQTFGEKFASYDVHDQTSRKVDPGTPVDVMLPNGVKFSATYSGVTPDKGLLRVNVDMGDFQTKVRIHDGGVFFQAGQKHDGGTLVVAVRATLDKN